MGVDGCTFVMCRERCSTFLAALHRLNIIRIGRAGSILSGTRLRTLLTRQGRMDATVHCYGGLGSRAGRIAITPTHKLAGTRKLGLMNGLRRVRRGRTRLRTTGISLRGSVTCVSV